VLRFAQITVGPVNDNLGLRRLLCGKASPLRGTCALNNLLRAVHQLTDCAEEGGSQRRPESRRLSAKRGRRAALRTEPVQAPNPDIQREVWDMLSPEATAGESAVAGYPLPKG